MIRGGAAVDHLQRRAVLAGQHADGRAAGGEVADHGYRDRLGKGGDAFGDDAMVTGEDHDGGRVDARARVPLQRCQSNGQGFQAAQGTRRLGQLLLPVRGQVPDFRHGPRDAFGPPFIHRVMSLRDCGMPAVRKVTRSQSAARS